MCNDIRLQVADQAERKGLVLNVAHTRLPDRVSGDEGRTRQALLNDVDNAIKFTRQGGVTIRAVVLADQGLAVTKRLAGLMGGDAGAGSTEGLGSTFWFTAHFRHARASPSWGQPIPALPPLP